MNIIKWRHRTNMTLAVDWGVKYQFKQTVQNYIEYGIYINSYMNGIKIN